MSVIYAEDREIGRVQHPDRSERSDIHQELAVAGHHQDALVGAGERQAEADHRGAAHRARHRIGVRPIAGQRRDIAARPSETADNLRNHRIAYTSLLHLVASLCPPSKGQLVRCPS